MVDIDPFINKLNEERRLRTVNKGFYEDTFLKFLDDPIGSEEFKQIKCKYKYTYGQKGGSFDEIKENIKRINENKERHQVILFQQNRPNRSILKILHQNFYKFLKNSYNLSFKGPAYVYSPHAHFDYKDLLLNSKIMINKKVKKQKNIFMFFAMSAKLATINSEKIIYIILNGANSVKMGGDYVLRFFLTPWMDKLFNLYCILMNTFEKTIVITSKSTLDRTNIVHFVFKNKQKEILLPKKQSFNLVISNFKNRSHIKDKLMKLSKDQFRFLDKLYEMELYINMLKNEDPNMHTVIQNKLYTKSLNISYKYLNGNKFK